MKEFRFSVLTCPKGQPRAKAARIGGFVRMYTPATANDFKGDIQKAAIQVGLMNALLEGPLAMATTYRLPRPKNHFGSGKKADQVKASAPRYWHTVKPDLDNIEKAVKDCLSNIRAWKDDCQVAYVIKKKIYVDGLEAPMTDITIKQIPDEPCGY